VLVTDPVVAALQLGIDLRTPRSEHERPATWVISRME
jgi:hypothetical protein